ncbi:MAG: hypothetical protein JWP12_3041 [Bacteroidetes bacterium]|nr:hypothetical protein [Bacteroidota bacterium]
MYTRRLPPKALHAACRSIFNMKKIIYLLVVIIAFTSCKSKLDKITLDDNPYDQAYTGPKVIRINSISGDINSTTGAHYNTLHVAISTELYEYVLVYRNGVLVLTASRSSYAPGNAQTENIADRTVVAGTVYTYTVALKYEEGSTQKSDAVVFTTP